MQFTFSFPLSFSKGPLSDGCAICFVARGSPKAAKSVQFTRTSGFQYCSTFRSILSCFASFLLAHEVFFSDFFPVLFLQQCKNFPSFFFEHIFVHLLTVRRAGETSNSSTCENGRNDL